MIRTLLAFAALAACTPAPQETVMNSRNPDPATVAQGSSGAGSDHQDSAAANTAGRGSGHREGAAQGPVPVPVSAAENPLPGPRADSPAEAEGRRTLSTAFVMVGPDGHLVVELRDGRVLVLRDVVMRRKDYCGVQVDGGKASARYCGGHAEVAAARPGGVPAPEQPDPAAPRLADSPGDPARRN